MTIRNDIQLHQSGIGLRHFAVVVAVAGLGGCSSLNSAVDSVLGKQPVAYQSAKAEKTKGLDVPPDLTQLPRDNRYTLPAAAQGTTTATALGYMQQQNAQPASAANPVGPKTNNQVRLERDGQQRWLVVGKSPEVLWPQIKKFWQEAGFSIETEMAEAGVMETDWAENRAKIPGDIIRRTLGKVLDSLYSTGERDKFRTRIEPAAGGSAIFITHRGLEEVLVGVQKDQIQWTSRPSDPELEAEFLARLMVFLGEDKEKAKAAVTTPVQAQDRARLMRSDGVAYLQMDEGFDRAWRSIGLALDRSGFTVEDRNRVDGLYYIRYDDQEQSAGKSKGFFSRWFSSSDSGQKAAQRYRILVTGSGSVSKVSVLNSEGRSETSATVNRILAVLQDQLK